MNCKLEYVDKSDKDIEKSLRIYSIKNSMSLLNSNEINQYFIDSIYKSIPAYLKIINVLLVLVGYNFKKDNF